MGSKYSKTCVKQPLSKRPKMVFKINYRLMHSAILLTFIKLPSVIKIFVLSIFEWLFYTGFTVYRWCDVEEVMPFKTKIITTVFFFFFFLGGGGGEHSGSVVECLTRDRGAASSSLTGVTALCPWARHINPSLVLVQPRKTRSYIIERLLMGRKESNQIKNYGILNSKDCLSGLSGLGCNVQHEILQYILLDMDMHRLKS